ncbi:hypothetical protein ACPOL_7110 (plasmid) [Acidisarcina polymorpha]|uniref:Uncharacterized protein n=1 Tax=Acidisarcina polymorpha TaxID=2211140 RepID=A0A2Z5GAM4_9BACT|nr:hypothetical protein ACPOL_7110 [Acidisarcina polymorpha]
MLVGGCGLRFVFRGIIWSLSGWLILAERRTRHQERGA